MKNKTESGREEMQTELFKKQLEEKVIEDAWALHAGGDGTRKDCFFDGFKAGFVEGNRMRIESLQNTYNIKLDVAHPPVSLDQLGKRTIGTF